MKTHQTLVGVGGFMRDLFIAVATLIVAGTAAAADSGPFVFEFEEIATGVWTGVRPDSPRFPVMGNTTFVISDEGVVVYDGGGMPAMSEQVIDKIRALTDKPVTHVVTSHWHGDHNFGIFRFAEEFVNVQFVAHEFTRDVMNSTRIAYIDRGPLFIENNLGRFQEMVNQGVDADGNAVSDVDRAIYRRIIDDADVIDVEFKRARVTPPNVVITDKYVIESGSRTIELLFLGHANTAGDIVMWLPDEKIVATGDIVVLPSPYAFNMPPRAWAQTLRNLKALEYETLIPGHGPPQTDTSYVDLLIETADAIGDQRDVLLAAGKTNEEVLQALDFSAYEERFTHGDEYVRSHYDEWFVEPFREAAMKALTGEPMVQIPPAESVSFDDARWSGNAVESDVVDYLGQRALRIKGGSALLLDADIKNGLVEFDIAVAQERGFAGLVFRAQDELNHEHFYVRPHQSGNPDANQYTPVYDGVAAWQLYYGEGYASPVEYRFNEWMHVKVIYAGSNAEVYIDSDEPVLHVSDLKRDEHSGAIGVNSANFSVAYFANFKYTQLADAYALPRHGAELAATPEGMIMEWQVSGPLDSELLRGTSVLDAGPIEDRSWTTLAAESTGITNLAPVHGLSERRDTVFARHVLNAKRSQAKLLTFGYSDKARVYLNGTLIYKGNNGYMSRDYRYLGTIGLFDSVVLPLKKGDNELWIAVSEAFGGWGIMAQISDFEGVP